MSKHIKRLKCVVCPTGCQIEVTMKNNDIINVQGFNCPKGKEYAIEEVTNPTRVVMSVIRVKNGVLPTVAVKTSQPVKKKVIPQIMEKLASIIVQAPVQMGEVIVENIADSNANIVATRPVKEASS